MELRLLVPIVTAILTIIGTVMGGVFKVEAMLEERFDREHRLNDRLYAPAESMARIEERLKSIDEKLAK